MFNDKGPTSTRTQSSVNTKIPRVLGQLIVVSMPAVCLTKILYLICASFATTDQVGRHIATFFTLSFPS